MLLLHIKRKKVTNRNLKIFQDAVAAGEELSPRDLFYYANECMDNQKYDDAVLLYETFLNQDEGWYEEKIYACGKLEIAMQSLDYGKRQLNLV